MEIKRESLPKIIGGSVAAIAVIAFIVLLMQKPPDAQTGAAAKEGQGNSSAASKPTIQSQAEATSPETPVAKTPETRPKATPAASNIFGVSDKEVASIRSKLKAIALAFLRLHDTRKTFNPGVRLNEAPQLSWRVYLLPFLDQDPLYRRFNLKEPWDSPTNRELLKFMPEVYRSGADNGESTHFVVMTGKDTLFSPGRSASMRNCRDGASNTLLVMHAGGGTSVPWTKPEDVPFDLANPLRGITPVNDNFEFAMVDGSVLSLSASAGPDIFAALVTPNGGEIIDGLALRNGRIPTITGRRPTPSTTRADADVADRLRSLRPSRTSTKATNAALANVPQAAVVPQVHTFERPGTNLAYDDATGHLMIVEDAQNQATLYSVDEGLKVIASAPAAAHPMAVAAKQYKGQSYFAVGGKLDGRVDLFKAKDGSLVRTMNLQGNTVMQLRGSQANDDPYIYYAVMYKDSPQPVLGRIDLAKQCDDGYLSTSETLTDFQISADGTLFYVHQSHGTRGFTSLRLVPHDPRFQHAPNYRYTGAGLERTYQNERYAETCFPDSQNALVAAGKGLYSATLADQLGEFDFPVSCFLPRTPWVFGLADGKLYVASINDKRTILSVPLPPEFAIEPDAQVRREAMDQLTSRVAPPIQLIADAERGRILIATKERVAVVDVKSLNLPNEPQLAVDVEGHKSFLVNKPAQLSIKSLDERIATRVVSAPAGLELKDGTIRWTPADADIGEAKLLIERTFDRFRFEQAIWLPVRRDFVPVPIYPRFVSLSADGALAVVWSQIVDVGGNSELAPGQNIAVVDVATGKVRAVRRIEKRVWTARVDSQGVYVLTVGTREVPTELLRLKLDDLTFDQTIDLRPEPTFAGFPNVEPVAGKYLVANNQIFTLPDLTLFSPKKSSRTGAIHPEAMQNRPAYPLGNDWVFEGIFWQGALEKAKLLYRPSSFIGVSDNLQRLELTPWGLTISNRTLQFSPDKQLTMVRDLNAPRPIVSSVVPAQFALNPQADINHKPAAAIDVMDLEHGEIAQEIVLERGTHGHAVMRENNCEIDAAGDVVAACVDGNLYFVPISEVHSEKLPKPFRFQLSQSPIVLAADAGTKAQYQLLDGKPPYEVVLTIAEERTRQKTQKAVNVPIDGRRVAAYVIEHFRNLPWPNYEVTEGEPRERIAEYLEIATPAFRRITGHNPKGVPIVVPVTLEATDARLRTTRMEHMFLVDIPTPRIIESLTKVDGVFINSYRPRKRVPGDPSRAPTEQDPARQKRIAEVTSEVAIDYGQKLRKAYPTEKMASDQLERQAVQARKACDEILTLSFKKAHDEHRQQVRTWSDRKGHTTEAQLRSVFADQVVLLQPTGREVTVAIDKLSEADQAFINEAKGANDLSDTDRAVAKMRTLLDAMLKHVHRENRFPPAYIVDDRGSPLLSWRVALLPDLGATELFALFHFDEPWNSTHNSKLLAYMPAVFTGQQADGSASMTPFLCFRSAESVLCDGHPLFLRDIKDPFDTVIIFGEVRENRAVPWTKPNDLGNDEFAMFAKLLKERNEKCLVALADNTVRSIPFNTEVAALQRAINRADGEPLEIQFENPLGSTTNRISPPHAAAPPKALGTAGQAPAEKGP